MLCYVGKATKIFIFIMVLLAVLGLVLGFTVFRHKTHKCDGRDCGRPDYVEPITAPAVLAPPATPTPLVEAAPPPPYSDRPVETSPPPPVVETSPPPPVVEASPPPPVVEASQPPYQPPAPPATVVPGPAAN